MMRAICAGLFDAQNAAQGEKALIIDAFEFARNTESLAGEIPLSQLTRVDLLERKGSLTFTLRGYVGSRNRLFLELHIKGSLSLRCERCLGPLAYVLKVRSVLWLAKTDAEADSLPLEEDAFDVVVGSERFDVDQLVEDEVLLALPVTPKHEVCPEPLKAPKNQADSPFSALKGLKTSGSGTTKN